MGLLCHHLIDIQIKEKGVMHLSNVHQHWHFVKPSNEPGPIATGQLLVLNPRIILGKGHPKGSKSKRKAVSSTKRDASAFEVETAMQRRVLRPRK